MNLGDTGRSASKFAVMIHDFYEFMERFLMPGKETSAKAAVDKQQNAIKKFLDEKIMFNAYGEVEQWLEDDHDPEVEKKISDLKLFIGRDANEAEEECIKLMLAACESEEERIVVLSQFLDEDPKVRKALARQAVTRNWTIVMADSFFFQPNRFWRDTIQNLPREDRMKIYNVLHSEFGAFERWMLKRSLGKIRNDQEREKALMAIAKTESGDWRPEKEWREEALTMEYINPGIAQSMENILKNTGEIVLGILLAVGTGGVVIIAIIRQAILGIDSLFEDPAKNLKAYNDRREEKRKNEKSNAGWSLFQLFFGSILTKKLKGRKNGR